MKKMTIEDRLALNRFNVDELDPHIKVDLECTDMEEIKKLLLACPARCYTYINDNFGFSHLGCLECGTCRVLSGGKIVKEWNHPQGSVGVTFRQG